MGQENDTISQGPNKTKLGKCDLEFDGSKLLNAKKMKMPDKCTSAAS